MEEVDNTAPLTTSVYKIDHCVVDTLKEIPRGPGWCYYLCDMIRPVPVRQMVEFLDKHFNPLKVAHKIPYFQDLFLLENYFCLCLTSPVDKAMRRRLSDLFWVKRVIDRRQVEQFLTSLKGGDRFYNVGDKVIIPLVHRHKQGTIRRRIYDKTKNSYNFVVEYVFHVDSYVRKFCVTVNKNDIIVSYARYNEDRLRQARETPQAPPPPKRKSPKRLRRARPKTKL